MSFSLGMKNREEHLFDMSVPTSFGQSAVMAEEDIPEDELYDRVSKNFFGTRIRRLWLFP